MSESLPFHPSPASRLSLRAHKQRHGHYGDVLDLITVEYPPGSSDPSGITRFGPQPSDTVRLSPLLSASVRVGPFLSYGRSRVALAFPNRHCDMHTPHMMISISKSLLCNSGENPEQVAQQEDGTGLQTPNLDRIGPGVRMDAEAVMGITRP